MRNVELFIYLLVMIKQAQILIVKYEEDRYKDIYIYNFINEI